MRSDIRGEERRKVKRAWEENRNERKEQMRKRGEESN